MIKTLKRQDHSLSDPQYQISILSSGKQTGIPPFQEILSTYNLELKATIPDILQVNLGKMCNQTCKHCHVDAGPDRKEIMTRETMIDVLKALQNSPVNTVDLTGGAPEMNPDFRWFVSEIENLGKHIIVRCNLTIILANPAYHDLPEFYAEKKIEVIASLPYFTSLRTDAQRGTGVFEKSIRALNMLNNVGYGKTSALLLNLVYNPTGAFLPGDQHGLEREFKRKLFDEFGVSFNNLYTITNLPVSRYLDYLISSGNLEKYMEKLLNSFNPQTVEGLMCRNTLSVGWNGHLYDCDFNQMLDLRLKNISDGHISNLDWTRFKGREIITNRHCFGCTAGAGSSCGGSIA